MKLVKAFLAGIAGLCVFVLLLSLLFPSRPRVQRTVLITGRPVDSVMYYLRDLRQWPAWHPLFSGGSAAPEGEVTENRLACQVRGQAVQFTRNKVDRQSVEIQITSADEHPITCQITCTPLTDLQQVRVDWVATHQLSWYPWQKFYAIFLDKLAGPGYEAALEGLRQHLGDATRP